MLQGKMNIKTVIYNFLREIDTKINKFNYINISFIVVITHTIILFSYLYVNGKLIKHLCKFKNNLDFLFGCIDNITIALIEQTCFPLYMNVILFKIIGDKEIARFFTCLLFTISHVLNFNLFYEIPTITLQLSTSFLMSLIYTKIDIIDSYFLNIFVNIFNVIITYLIWKFIFKISILQKKKLFAPVKIILNDENDENEELVQINN